MTVDAGGITAAADRNAGSTLLVRVAILCASVAFLDGVDTSSINIAAPRLADHLGLSRPQLGPVFSSGLLGAMIGALSFGPMADRFGRKRLLLVATTTFGAFTVLTAFTNSFSLLLLMRLLTGIGLGGATPCFIALASEYAPRARQARVTGLVWTAFPLGTVLGTFICAYLVARHGWQSIFLVGGIAPLLVTVALAIWLPESRQLLLIRAGGSRVAGRNVQGLPPSLREDIEPGFGQTSAGRAPIAELFSKGQWAQTLLLWFAFAVMFGTTVTVFSWSPILMRDHGIPLGRAAVILGVGGLGSLTGSACAGFLMERFRPAVLLAVTTVLGSLAVACIGYAARSQATMVGDLMLTGFFVAGIGGAGLLALAASTYPLVIRSTGVGGAMGFGRFGQVLMPLVPSTMILAGFGARVSFLVIGGIVLLGAVALLLLQGHATRSGVRAVGGMG